MQYDVRDLKLAAEGKLKIEWAGQQMPVLQLIKARFAKEKPYKNKIIGALLHLTSETANLIFALQAGGATVIACAANSHSTQDDVTASLVKDFGVSIFGIKEENAKTYDKHINKVLSYKPDLFIDDGADLSATYEMKIRDKSIKPWNVIGASEETTTGMHRFRAMEKKKILSFPIVAVNDSQTKYLFDNRYGTGQSTIDAIMRATDILYAGKQVVVGGYGWCARGVAMRAKGMGANVTITEVDPVKALEAVMDGYLVEPMREAIKKADVVITATGGTDVITAKEALLMKDGAIIANAGHFYVEFDYYGIKKLAKKTRKVREFVEEFTLPKNKKIYVLGEGRLINLAAAKGHPASVMDMSFVNQALAAEWLIKNHGKLENRVYLMPEALDRKIAYLKLQAMGVRIDKLNNKQEKYLNSWE